MFYSHILKMNRLSLQTTRMSRDFPLVDGFCHINFRSFCKIKIQWKIKAVIFKYATVQNSKKQLFHLRLFDMGLVRANSGLLVGHLTSHTQCALIPCSTIMVSVYIIFWGVFIFISFLLVFNILWEFFIKQLNHSRLFVIWDGYSQLGLTCLVVGLSAVPSWNNC